MQKYDINKKDADFFLPPYEWFNKDIADWCNEAGITLINFSPGTSSNGDYTIPTEKNYYSSQKIYDKILDYEKKKGLNGFLLLTHIGTDPRRTDKFYNKLDDLIRNLQSKGYKFVSLKENLK